MKSKLSTTKGGGKLSPPLPDPDLAKWCAVLAELNAPTDVVPPGWRTLGEIAKQIGITLPTLQRKIRWLLKEGKAERKNFRIQLAKNVRPVAHYRLK